MDNHKLNMELFEKITAEQDGYRDWLLRQPPEEILKSAYEYAVREDIVLAMEDLNLENGQAAALLAITSPLSDIYNNWERQETNYMDAVRNYIETHAEQVFKARRELPVYQHTMIYAREHGEMEEYRAAYKMNVACKREIEAAISEHYSGYQLDCEAAVRQVVCQFGFERVLYVLAATVQDKDWDGRFSAQNKEWARTVPIAADKDEGRNNRNALFVVDSVNPGLTDLFLRQARQEWELATENSRKSGVEQTDRTSGRRSVRKQLIPPVVPDNKLTARKNKEQEVR